MPPPPTTVSRPGRALGVLVVVILALGAAMWFGNAKTPKLALDLSGGTTVTLTAVTESGGQPPESSMERAVQIIRSRVNGLGVSEAEVSQQGGNHIVVAVPGEGQERVVELVGRTAKLRFRQVLLSQPVGMTPTPTSSPTSGPTSSPSPSPTGDDGEQGGDNNDKNDNNAEASPSASATASSSDSSNHNRALSPALLADSQPKPDEESPKPSPSSTGLSQEQLQQLRQQLQQQRMQRQQDTSGIDKDVLAAFRELDCSQPEKTRELKDPNKQIVACNRDGTTKYVLSKAKVQGTMVDTARSGLPPAGSGVGGGWLVQLEFDSEGTKRFGAITSKVVDLAPPRNQVAIALDGVVVSAPRIEGPITGGQAEITGDFTQRQAEDLANVLKYGALPLKFNKSDITSVSPTLGADSLRAGLLAGALGLALIVVYCLFYYRALGLVAISSLGLAGVLTYAAVALLGKYIGYRLSLAGVAGLIVAIGITVDSFIVYFERLRDEVRGGRSMRAGVERGWLRARRTILVADGVVLLAAIVLWLLAVGGVKGFAFTLGLTTILDTVVVFLFTKPMVTYLSRTRFFGSGHVLSGLDPGRMGIRAPSEVLTARRRGAKPREA